MKTISLILCSMISLTLHAQYTTEQYITVTKAGGGDYIVGLNGQTDGYIVGRDGSASNKFIIHSNGATYFNGGRVGIGTNLPYGKFHIENTTTFNLNEAPVGQDHILFSAPDPGNGGYFGALTWQSGGRRRASIAATREHTDGDFVGLAFFTKGVDGAGPIAESMRITRDGNVGIGTSTPGSSLDVVGNLRTSSYITANQYIALNKGRSYLVAINAQGDAGYISGRNDAYEPKFEIRANGTSFFDGGSVGIGTKTTGSFKLAVNGKIWTQEVNVAMTNPGPDYVFEEDYDLLSLTELETYIKQNKHLPEVPSAKQMDEEGLNLKEMNLILLKKVEELTLHLIEMNDINDRQKQINLEQEKMNKMLLEQIKSLNAKS